MLETIITTNGEMGEMGKKQSANKHTMWMARAVKSIKI